MEGVRDGLAVAVARSDAFLGRIGNVARFLVAFLVPAAVIFVYRELLVRQQRQRELEARLESERQLSRSREEFIANASHELRTPLTGITGLAMLLAEDPALSRSEGASELLNLIISESGDLARMIEDLLTTARLDAGALHYNFEDVKFCDEVSEVVEPMTRSGAEISVQCDPGLVRADRLRLRQVLRNLLSNALKYGGSGIEVQGRVEGANLCVLGHRRRARHSKRRGRSSLPAFCPPGHRGGGDRQCRTRPGHRARASPRNGWQHHSRSDGW